MVAPVKIYEQDFLRPGTYRGAGSFSAADLAEYAKNTNRLLADGIEVPVFTHHKQPGSRDGGPRRPGDQIDSRDVVGRLRAVGQKPDGTIYQRLEISDPRCIEQIESRRVKFSSPELVKYTGNVATGGDFREYGRIIRHVALTPTPRNPDQGPFTLALSENSTVQFLQFSLDDYENAGTPDAEMEEFEADKTAVQDMGEKKVAKQVLADLEAAGIAAPRGVDPTKDPLGFLSQLSAALRQLAISKAQKEADEDDDEDTQVREESGIAQYSESEDDMSKVDELTKTNERLQQERDALVAQFAEQRREALVAHVEAKKYPKPIAEAILSKVQTVQFADDGTPAAAFTVDEVLKLVDEVAATASKQFADSTSEVAHPDGEKFFRMSDSEEVTADEAQKIVENISNAWHEPAFEGKEAYDQPV